MDMDQQAQREEFNKLVANAEKDGIEMTPAIIDLFRSYDDASKAMTGLQGYLKPLYYARAAKQHSIVHTYGSTHADFKQPTLSLNEAAKPSNKGGVTTLPNSEGEKVTVPKPKAIINHLGDDHYVPIQNMRLPTEYPNGMPIISGLAAKVDNTSHLGLEYVNESEVQGICLTMIEDALKCLGLSTSEVCPRLEVSIYTMRPDILVVLRREGRIIFVIEVKNPELKDGDVFKNENVAGQIVSYLMALHSLGDSTPMGAIMTYNKIALVTLGDYTQQSFEDAVEKTKSQLQSRTSPKPREPKTEASCQDRTSTPVKSIKYYTQETRTQGETTYMIYGIGEQFDSGTKDDDDDTKLNLQAFMSDVKQGGDVFPFLVQSLLIAYNKGDGVKDEVAGMQTKDRLGDRLAFKVAESSFDWVKIRPGVEATITTSSFAHRNIKSFYIFGKLGEGSVAAVYLAASTGGHVCAMKSYFLKPSTGRSGLDQQNRNDVDQLSKTEASRWLILYKDRGLEARSLWLGDYPCTLMTYGRSLEQVEPQPAVSVEETRWRKILDVKKELIRFAQLGFKYSQSDLRWAHVLVDQKGEIFFCDLESLEDLEESEKGNDETIATIAWEQLKILIKPISRNEDFQNCLTWGRTDFQGVETIVTQQQVLQDLINPGNTDLKGRLEILFPDVPTDELSAEAIVCLQALWFFKKLVPVGKSKTDSPNSASEPSLKTESGDGIMDDEDDEGDTREPKSKRTKSSQ
mmetsp:Transcript_10392/g.24940  ORF Transcript_10392/g.24940 Transcript_10392/m.24940 type:complete len:742 (-) Transcript_10392:123-2348(-)